MAEDGSVVIDVNMNTSKADKSLAKLKGKIEDTEREIAETTKKRDDAQQKSIFDAAELDKEKAKLQEIKDRLSDIKAQAKDKSLSIDYREDMKSLIPSVQEELSEQRTRVSLLQAEWNKTNRSIERYNEQIAKATEKLHRQEEDAGGLQQKINEIEAERQKIRESAVVGDQKTVEMNQQLLDLKKRQKELEASGVGFGYEEYDKNASRIAEITKNMKEYQKALSGAGASAGANMSSNVQAAEKMASILGKISGVLSGGSSAAIKEIGSSIGAISPYARAAVAAVKLLNAAINKVVETAVKFNRSFVEALKKGGEVLKKFGKAAVEAFQKAAASALALLKKINIFPKIFSSIKKSWGNIGGLFSPKKVNSLGKVFKKLGQMIRRVFVFSVITSGLRAIRNELSAYLNINTQFTTALRQLKGVLLTAFQPIYEAVVPALVTLINVISRALAAVTQFIAVLFGTTAKKAQENAKSLYEQAHATKEAGKAAEKAAGSLAAFDEINTINTENKSAGGGAEAEDKSPLFDWEYDETPFNSWGEAFDAFLDKILDNIPKLKKSFGKFADWLNDLSKKLYDMFTFPGVLDKVKKIGRDLADALNYLVNKINWNQLGKALGAGLNLALNFLTSFLYAFNWMNLGRKLADFVNGLVSEVDGYELGRLLWAKFKIALETFAGFLLGLDMPQLAEWVSNIVKGFFDEMTNTLWKIPWGDIGRQIAEFLINLDWYGMLSSVTNAIAAALMAAVAALNGFIGRIRPEVDRIAKEIVTAFIEFFRYKVSWGAIAQAIGDGITTALRFVAGLLDPELFYEIGRAVGEFFAKVPWGEILSSLGQVIANGLKSAIASIRGFLDVVTPELDRIANDIVQSITSFFRDQVEWGELAAAIGDGIAAALHFVADLLDPDMFYEIGKAIGDFLINVPWVEILGGLADAIANGINSAIALVNGILDSVTPEKLHEIAEGIAQKINEFVKTVHWEELGQTLADCINTAVEFLLTLLGEIDWKSIWDSVITFINTAINETDWESVGELFGETIKEKIERVTEFLGKIDWAGIVRAIVNFLAGVDWIGLAGDITQKLFEMIGAAVEGVISLIIDLPKILEIGFEIVAGILKGIINALLDLPSWLKEHIVDPIVNGIRDLFGLDSEESAFEEIGGNLIGGLLDGLKGAWESVKTWAGGAAGWLKGIFEKAKTSVSKAPSSGSNRGFTPRSITSMPDVNTYSIPALAQGAVIPPNREFMAVLGDQKNGTNVEAPAELIKDMVLQAMRESGGMTGIRTIEIPVNLDGVRITKVVVRNINDMTRSAGKPVIDF